MTAKRWFYAMLSLPVAIPLLLGLLAHLYYFIVPHPEFTFTMEANQVHHTFANGRGMHTFNDNPITRATEWILMPTAGYPVLIATICSLLNVYLAPYLIFLVVLIAWSWRRPFHELRKILWWLPVLAYPLLVLWIAVENPNPTLYYKLIATLRLQLIAAPIYFAVAYFYMLIAWRLVPSKYRREL